MEDTYNQLSLFGMEKTDVSETSEAIKINFTKNFFKKRFRTKFCGY